MGTWKCVYCGTENSNSAPFRLPGDSVERCRECHIARHLAEFQSTLTRQEAFAVSLVAKFDCVDPDTTLLVAREMDISPERVVQILSSAREKLEEELISGVAEKALGLGLLGTTKDFV